MRPRRRRVRRLVPAGGVNFADIAERINPAVVNIDATSRGRLQLPEGHPMPPELFGPGGAAAATATCRARAPAAA